MYLLAKFGDHRSYRSGDYHIARFLKSGIPISHSEVPDTAGRKTRRRRTQAIAKRLAFYANAINPKSLINEFDKEDLVEALMQIYFKPCEEFH